MNSSSNSHHEHLSEHTDMDLAMTSFDDPDCQMFKKRTESLKPPPRDISNSISLTSHSSSFIDTTKTLHEKNSSKQNKRTPGEAPNRSRSSFGSEKSSSNSALWILVRLEEMGVKIDSEAVAKMVMKYPAETSRDFIIEAILQNEFEKTSEQDEEEEKEESVRDRQDTPYYNDSFPNLADHSVEVSTSFKCQVCTKEFESYQVPQVFSCAHRFCHSCVLVNFEHRIKNGEDIETFVCPQENCDRSVVADKLAKFVPEVDFKDMGELEIGTCSICFDDIKGNENLLKIFECQTHLFCYNCTLDYLKEAIYNRKVLDLKCPDSSCESFANDNKMKELIPTYLFNRYHKYKTNALVERNPNLRWCTRPGCEKVVKATNNNLKARCECGQLTCIGCGNPWHNKMTCEQALEEEYKVFAKQEGISFCPECKSRVEKSTGCNHMTCPICTYEWCWLCGGEYTRNHFDIFNPLGCPGLMSGNQSKKKWSKCKLIAYKLMFVLLAIILLPFAPLGVVIAAIIVPNMIFENLSFDSCITTFLVRTLLVIVGVILLPLTLAVGLIGAIVPGTCYLFIYLRQRSKERASEKNRRRELIQKRLKKVEAVENLENRKSSLIIENLENHRGSIILENNNQVMLAESLLEP